MLKSRKEIRLEAEALQRELAELKSPVGLARYMFSLGGNEEFEEAFRKEIDRLGQEAEADELSADDLSAISDQRSASDLEAFNDATEPVTEPVLTNDATDPLTTTPVSPGEDTTKDS